MKKHSACKLNIFRCLWTIVIFSPIAFGISSASAFSINGSVLNADDGSPVDFARVTIIPQKVHSGPDVITVVTDESGKYRVDLSGFKVSRDMRIEVSKIGWSMLESVNLEIKKNGPVRKNLFLKKVMNVADQVPASAWMSAIEESKEKHETQLHCIGCHQFPTKGIIEFAEDIETTADAKAHQHQEREKAWKIQARKEAWRSAVKYMRAKSYDIFPEGTEIDLAKIPWETVQAPEYSLFNENDEVVVSEFLSRELPKDFSHFPSDLFSYGAPVVSDSEIIFYEYSLPDTSLVREAIPSVNTHFIWGADIQKNRILRLNERTGERKWFPVPYEGSTGPHTIVSSGDGDAIWVSMLESNQLGRFDAEKETWKLFSLQPNDPGSKVFGGEGMVHDIGFGPGYTVKKASDGRIWLTLIGGNKLAALDEETGEVEHVEVPKPESERTELSTALYSLAVNKDGRCVWWGQLLGYYGCYDVEKKEHLHLTQPSSGSGPRRMSIDKNDVLWVPFYGSGQVAKINASNGNLEKTYDLPDRSSAPYSVTWDEFRKVLWIGTANADVIYRFNPKTEEFHVVPLPRGMGYLRKIAIDPQTKDLVSSYANIPTGSGPSMVLRISVKDKSTTENKK